MLIHRWRTAACITALFAVTGMYPNSAPADTPAADIQVGPNIQVSTEDRRTHAEVHLAIDPEDPQHLAACSIIADHQAGARVQGSGSRTVLYVSHDGGKSWAHAVEDISDIAPSGQGKSWDPTCEYGLSGTLYFGTATVLDQDVHRMRLHRSPDRGKTWLEPSVIDAGFDDKPVLIPDTRPESPYRGRLYVTYGGKKKPNGKEYMALVAFSEDEGRRFSSPVVAQDPGGDVNGGTVLSDGTLAIVGKVSPEVTVSRDGGQTVISRNVVPQMQGNFHCLPSIATDSSEGPFRDRIYVVWCGIQEGISNILLAYSTDRGHTWSGPRVVDYESAGTPAEGRNTMPVVAVNGEGVVGVSWYDRRNNPDNFGYYVRFSASFDGGDGWLPSARVSERPNSVSNVLDAQAPFGLKTGPVERLDADAGSSTLTLRISGARWVNAGHYAGLAAGSDGVFHALWVDNRTGIEQVWTAPILVSEHNNPNPEPTSSTLVDVTDRVTLSFDELMYQRTGPTTGIVAGNVYAVNTSADILQLPMRLHVMELALGPMTGATGSPTLQFDLEHTSTIDAQVLNLDAAFVGRGLVPSAMSEAVPFQIIVGDLKTDDPRGAYGFELSLRARVLGVLSLND